jgi:hypothetical protein
MSSRALAMAARPTSASTASPGYRFTVVTPSVAGQFVSPARPEPRGGPLRLPAARRPPEERLGCWYGSLRA